MIESLTINSRYSTRQQRPMMRWITTRDRGALLTCLSASKGPPDLEHQEHGGKGEKEEHDSEHGVGVGVHVSALPRVCSSGSTLLDSWPVLYDHDSHLDASLLGRKPLTPWP